MNSSPTNAEANTFVRTPADFYRPELDVLRFVAFFMVYLNHSISLKPESPHWIRSFSNACAFGVPLFFALSAYLITELLMIEKRRTGSVSTKSFYIRRIFRIWPLYFPILLGGFLLSHLHRDWLISTPGLIAYIFLVGNWYTSRHVYLSAGIGPLWSVSVEEQFYLVWPLLVRYGTRLHLGIVCCLGWGCSQAVLVFLCLHHAPLEPAVWTNSLTHLQYFTLGAGVSLLLNGSAPRIRNNVRVGIILLAMILLFASNFVFNSGSGTDLCSVFRTYPNFLLAGASTTLMLVGFLGNASLQGCRNLSYLGKISYGMYLYHLPVLMVLWAAGRHLLKGEYPFTVMILGLPLTIGVASVSYRCFEMPFLRMKKQFEIVKSRPV